MNIIDWMLARLREPSSWAGVAAGFLGLGALDLVGAQSSAVLAVIAGMLAVAGAEKK